MGGLLLQQGVNFLLLGSIYALVSIGLNMVYGIMRIINFAHAQFYMVGAFMAVVFANWLGLHYVLAVVMAFVVTVLLGSVAEFLIVRPVQNDELRAMTSTLGLLLILGAVASLLFGPQQHSVDLPVAGGARVLGVYISFYSLILIACVACSLIGLTLLLRRTWTGRALYAISQNVDGARLQGINVSKMRLIGFGLGCGLAGLAGALMAPIIATDPNTGDSILLKIFIILVLGGLGTLVGAAIGAFTLAAVETLGIVFFGQFSILVAYLLVLLVLILWPAGLLRRAR
jgi:branched-chain amino acid transport system permease protein